MRKKISIIFFTLLTALLLFATTKPDTFYVERSTRIKAPADKIFSIINDHHQWSAWSPWEKLDPTMKKTYSGPVSGKRAIVDWEGNNEVGAGRSEIIESIPSSKITIKLDMLKPFETHNIVDFTLQPEGETTHVIWAMHGPQPYIAKVASIFINCDKMIGKQFEEGLSNLKNLAEK